MGQEGRLSLLDGGSVPEAPPPTPAAARERIAAVRPDDYARSRNHLDGAVTGLSPYITHGFVGLPEVLAGVLQRQASPLPLRHRLVMELGWRAYFRHVWAHRGDGILRSLHPGPLPDAAYAVELPEDVRDGRTGVPAIDQAVRTLHATGTLHNHARLWLASYLVHLRQVHWRVGADWLYGHLLDGDLASNHLSWQWVAGTASRQPYLFNADNVARHAPPAWHSPGTEIDATYDELARRARQPGWPQVCPAGTGVDRPGLLTMPPADLGFAAPEVAAVRGREVWLVHPWNLGELPDDLPAGTLVLGLAVADFHRTWPWHERRWRFAGTRMAALAPLRWFGSAAAITEALAAARRVHSTAEPHLAAWLPAWARCRPAPALFPEVSPCCDSFSQWWPRATRGRHHAQDLLIAGALAQAAA